MTLVRRQEVIILRWVLITVLAILSRPPTAFPESHAPWTLESVLHELDSRAHGFKGFTADIERTKVTVVVNDKSTEQGTIAVRGDKMRLEMTKPDSRTILRDGDDFYIYTPGLKRVEEYNLGGKRQMVDSFVLLGFGNSGKELQSQYLLSFMGESPVDNRKAVKLELTPKSDDVRQQIAKIDLWLDESNWLPVQQQFFEAGTDDYFIIHYTNIVPNARIDENTFKPKWPKGTQRLKHTT